MHRYTCTAIHAPLYVTAAPARARKLTTAQDRQLAEGRATQGRCQAALRGQTCIKSQIIANTCIPMPTGKLPFICKGNNLQK
eukprot:UN3804